MRGRGGRAGCSALVGGVFCHPRKFPFHSLHPAASSWSEMTSLLRGGLASSLVLLRAQGSFMEHPGDMS